MESLFFPCFQLTIAGADALRCDREGSSRNSGTRDLRERTEKLRIGGLFIRRQSFRPPTETTKCTFIEGYCYLIDFPCFIL